MAYSKPRLPTDLLGIIQRLRKAADDEGWNQANLIMELCNKAEEMFGALKVAEQCICQLIAKLHPMKEEALLQLIFNEQYNHILAAIVRAEGDKE